MGHGLARRKCSISACDEISNHDVVSLTGERVLGAILFEMTMDRLVDGVPTASYLWQRKNVVPFLKVDKGLADQVDGAQVMKPMPELDALLERAVSAHLWHEDEVSDFICQPGWSFGCRFATVRGWASNPLSRPCSDH